ncbi:MAPEG family protein [Sphingomonas sp. RP10(2022)]|uniref:MAPEG family protein n=1 Tax=Sphingomonas liriopis TaxID=2949094 RepID=A0A9X2HWZ0_9SPHN|nr:MAPEG family protein [Sphingomonas liriopis]MCP3735093.1 MAPEG family protein [Sphingomonas liriopis]
MLLPVTLTIAAAAGIGNIALAMRVVPIRLKDKVLFGDNGDSRLLARTRAHANFVEYTPFVLILMALIEAGGGSARWLGIAGGTFVAARIAHAVGMDRATSNPWRAAGALLTWTILLALAVWALAVAYGYGAAPVIRVLPVEGSPMA